MPSTTVYVEANPFKGNKLKHSIAKQAFPKGLVDYPNSLPFNVISPSTKLWSFPWITITKSSSKVQPKTNKSSSSKWVNITMDVIPSQGFSAPISFVFTVKPVTKPMISNIIPAKARNVPPVTRRDVPTTYRINYRVTPALVVTVTSLENNVLVTTTSIPAQTGRKQISPKRLKTCATPIASAPTVTDYSDLARSKRDTSVVLPSAPRAKNITISIVINVTSRIPPNWNRRRKSYGDIENVRLMVRKTSRPKTISSSTGTVRPCKTRVSMYPISCALPPPTATPSFISKGPPASRISSIG